SVMRQSCTSTGIIETDGAVCHYSASHVSFTREKTMKQLVLVGTLAGALAAGSAFAQQAAGKATESGGRTTPSEQPATAPSPTVPTGDLALGSVRLPRDVMADGKKLAAGTYQVRVTGQVASPDAKG